MTAPNVLYYGDNLNILRHHSGTESYDASGTVRASERSHYLLWLDEAGQPGIRVALTRTT